ncbi:Signal peptidase I [Vibrio chagasii]|nr:Signal peptidase I [Vibrio chagasii]
MLKRTFKKIGISKSDIAFVVGIVIFKGSIVDMNTIPSESMMPLMKVDDRVHVDKLAYSFRLPMTTTHLWRWDTPKSGEVVTFIESDSRSLYIKRVIGVEGDLVNMVDGVISVNGVTLDQVENTKSRYTAAGFMVATENNGHLNYPVRYSQELSKAAEYARDNDPTMIHLSLRDNSWVVPEGKILVMGDNRDESYDSRFFDYTFVDVDSVTGRAKQIIGNFTPVMIADVKAPIIFSGITERWRSIYDDGDNE